MSSKVDAKQALRLLTFLGERGPCQAMAITDTKDNRVLLRAANGATLLCAPDTLHSLKAADVIAQCDNGYTLTPTGRMRYKRLVSGAQTRKSASDQAVVDPFRAQHLELSQRQVNINGNRQTVLTNDAESPLTRLHKLKAPGGGTWLDDAAFAAGERLRADFTHGRLMQRTTSSWNFETGITTSSGQPRTNITEQAMDARVRLEKAIGRVGPDLAGVLLDVCCFLKGLESVERERRWPPRSAKLMLRTGLNLLAEHYGTRAGVGRRRTLTAD
ncbi:MAG: DUF6456 domain-containing protein [Pseudomonadota bacterium]